LRNDKVAARTTWVPLQPHKSASYKTRSCHRPSEHLLTFDPTQTSKILVKGMFVGSVFGLVREIRYRIIGAMSSTW